MNIDKGLSLICSKPENARILKKYISKMENDDIDLLYEIGFLLKQEKKPMSDVFDLLKKGKLGFQHPNFQDIAKRILEMDHFMDKPFEVTEGVNHCGKCSSTRTLSYSRQTRGGDEGMTVYVFCVDCKHRYVMNS